jgi:hypothetical protein
VSVSLSWKINAEKKTLLQQIANYSSCARRSLNLPLGSYLCSAAASFFLEFKPFHSRDTRALNSSTFPYTCKGAHSKPFISFVMQPLILPPSPMHTIVVVAQRGAACYARYKTYIVGARSSGCRAAGMCVVRRMGRNGSRAVHPGSFPAYAFGSRVHELSQGNAAWAPFRVCRWPQNTQLCYGRCCTLLGLGSVIGGAIRF